MKFLNAIAAALLCAAAAGCGTSSAASKPDSSIVYVDIKTRETVVLERQAQTPATNPATGQRTLMPGLYCSQCQAWHASPPIEVLQRSTAAYRCKKCGTTMTPNGPTNKTSL